MEISPVYVHTQNTPIPIEQGEVLRYMGCGKNIGDEIVSLANRASEMIRANARPKACYRILPVQVLSDGKIDFQLFSITSSALSKHLSGCAFSYIFAATLGVEIDRLILRATHTEPSLALALQASAAAAIESYCDVICDSVLSKEGQLLGRRFSAGYGDVALEHQRALIDALDASRKIGLTLTDGYMMVPSKSVTAFVGIGAQCAVETDKCANCNKLNCEFRRGK